ncbi:hypothetical protein D3C81_1334490 [compost metagenome]
MRSHIMAISLTKAMLTLRNVFSSSLDISATLGEETGTTVWTYREYSAVPKSRQAFVVPPMTFGVLKVLNFEFDGSTRSGEKQRKKSLPAVYPSFSSSCWISSSVVPG